MDGAELTPEAPMHHMLLSSSRPTLGFPLGTAMLLIIIFCLSGMFSCCYHWDKLRSLRGRSSSSASLPTTSSAADHSRSDQEPSSFKLTSMHQDSKQRKDESLPVIMPGDQIPKFMAWPCPCQPPPVPNSERILTVGVDLVFVPSIQIESHPTPTSSPSAN